MPKRNPVDFQCQKVIGKRLKHIRRNFLEITQVSMANLMKTNLSTYRSYEQGLRRISFGHLSVLLDLNFNMNWLLFEVGSIKLSESEEIHVKDRPRYT